MNLIDKGLTTNIKYAKYLIGPDDDYIKALDYKNFGLSGDETINYNGIDVKCSDLYNDISDSDNIDKISNFFTERVKALTHPTDMDQDSFETYINAVFKNLVDPYSLSSIGDFKQSMVNMAIGLSIPKLMQKYGIGLNGLQITQGVAAEKSRMNLINEGLGSFNWLMGVIPSAMNILFVFLIALYLPIAIVAVMVGTERGTKILTNYFFGLVAFKSIDIGLAVAHNIANYYAADKIGQLYYGMGKNLFNVLNIPYMMGDIGQAAGLAGLLGMAAVFITPSVIFYGESKAAIGLLGAVKGMYAGTNPDLAAAETNKLQGNLEYQEELNNNRAMKHIAESLGIDTAEGAKLYNQMQGEIDAINRGAAFGAVAANDYGSNDMLNYAKGSFAKSLSADYQTVGAGAVVTSSAIHAIENGSFAMGAKNMAQVIGYGSEVNVADAVVSGLASGTIEANKDNYIGSHITKGDARAIGTQQGASLVNQGEALIKSGAYDSDGDMTEIGEEYNSGLQKEQAMNIRKTAKIGRDVSFANANRVGDLRGITEAEHINDVAEKMTDEEARAAGAGGAVKEIANGKNWLKNKLTNSDGSLNENTTIADVLSPYKKDLEQEKNKISEDYDKKIAAALRNGDAKIANKLYQDKMNAIDNIDDKIAQVDSEIKEQGNKKLLDAYFDGSAKGFAKSIMQTALYGASGKFEYAENAGVVEGVKAGGADKGEYLAVLKDKGGINDLFNGAEREARFATNKTIGTGEAILTDKNGHKISEEKFMGFVKAGAAKGFLAQGLAGEADLEKAFHGQGKHGEKELSKEMAKGLYRSEEANLGNIASMAHLKDEKGKSISDDEFYKNIRAQGIEKGDLSQAHAEKMRGTYGDTLDEKADTSFLKQRKKELEKQNKNIDDEISSIIPRELLKDSSGELQQRLKALQEQKAKNENEIQSLNKMMENPMTFAQVAAKTAESQVQSQYGQALGINENLNKNAAMYAENAQYGEMSKQQTTNERINQLGGVDKAVAFDNTMADMKAVSDKASAKAQIEEALKASGLDENLAKKFAEEILNGSREGAKEFAEALNKIGEKAETLTGAKERSDYASINAAGGDEQYKETLANKASIDMAKEAGSVEQFMKLINNPEALDKALDKLSKHMDVSNLRGKYGLDFLKALGEAKALYFGGSNAIVGADGKVFQGALTPDGKVGGKINGGLSEIIDNSFTKKQGQTYQGQLRNDIHKGIEHFLTSMGVDPNKAKEIADGVIAGWDEYKDVVEGAVAIGGGYGIYKKAKDLLHSRFPKNSSTNTSPNLNAKNNVGNVNPTKTDHLTTSNSSISDSLDNRLMGGLKGEPYNPSFLEKAKYSIGKKLNKFKSLAKTTGKFALDVLDKAAVPLTVAEFAYEANKEFHKAEDEGYSTGMAFWLGGLKGGGDILHDTVNGLTFGYFDKAMNNINANVAQARTYFDRSQIKAIADNPQFYNSPVPNMGHISHAALMQSPITSHDAINSVTAQVQSLQLQQRLVQDQEYMKQFVNPTNPAFGVTMQTAAGNLSLSTSPRGTLEIGSYQTNVPVSEFRNYMNSHPEAYQNFISTIANSKLNDNNAPDLFSGYQKLDNGRVENILQVMQYHTSRQADNTMIGLMEQNDLTEKSLEQIQKLNENIKKVVGEE